MNKTKVCTKCKEELPLEMFGNHKGTKDGLNCRCKHCCRQHYYDNREHKLIKAKEYRENNKEKIADYKKQHYEENKEAINLYKKQWYEENKKDVLKRMEKYRIENADMIRENKKIYTLKNRGHGNLRAQRYRTRKRKLPSTLTNEQWEQIKKDFNYTCAYCGKSEDEQMREYGEQLHQEHFIPLSKGGEYTHNNIIPACKGCNASKNNRDFFVWYPLQSFNDTDRKQKMLEYLNYTTKNIQQLSIL